jgi:hypothetical protein
VTPETATALLAKMGPTCILCGAVNPPTVPARTQFGTTVPEHEECPEATQKMIAGLRPPAAPSIDDCRDALATVIDYAATIARLERELAERDAAPPAEKRVERLILTAAPAIASLRELAIQAFSIDLAAEVDFDADSDAEGLSSEEPRIVLAYNLERTATPWQAMLTFDGGMGGEVLTAGNNEATPVGAVESLRDAITPETQGERP